MIRRSLLPFVLIIVPPLLGTGSAAAQGSAAPPGTPVDSFSPAAVAPRAGVAPAEEEEASSGRPLLGVPVSSEMGGAEAGVDAAREVSAAAAAPAAEGLSGKGAFGISGALRAAVLRNSQPVDPALLGVPVGEPSATRWEPVLGTVRGGLLGDPVARAQVVAPDGPGVWRLALEGDSVSSPALDSLLYLTTVPLAQKRNGRLNGYHIGTYPTERSPRSDVYAPPEAFIEVTPENQDLQISEHFRLRHFLTKDQFDVWPKYLALNLRLVDKLELVIQELNAMGVRALAIHVMSGFRTPQYNGPGGDGRATLSRHMYGDAADVWVDGDHDGYIDDLNGDGRHDIRDAEVLLRAVERVEQKYPELTGGAGLYEANDEHGPYVHVDVRGTRARW